MHELFLFSSLWLFSYDFTAYSLEVWTIRSWFCSAIFCTDSVSFIYGFWCELKITEANSNQDLTYSQWNSLCVWPFIVPYYCNELTTLYASKLLEKIPQGSAKNGRASRFLAYNFKTVGDSVSYLLPAKFWPVLLLIFFEQVVPKNCILIV